ncbi:MAG: hypothetical protein PHO57_03125 [Acidithiobacillus sp.]|nr:hypothetical protein [Acidithiobacillus sp.]
MNHRNRNKQIVITAVALAVGTIALFDPLLALASAQNAGVVASNVTGNYSDFSKFLTGGAYVIGAGAVIHGLHKFWQKSHDQGGQIKASSYAIPIVVGGGLVAVAASIGTPVATLFGSGVNSTNAGDSGTTSY